MWAKMRKGLQVNLRTYFIRIIVAYYWGNVKLRASAARVIDEIKLMA